MVQVIPGLEKIMPRWAKKIAGKEKIRQLYEICHVDGKELDISSHSNCMVGEAYNFNWGYSDSSKADGCRKCEKISMDFMDVIAHGTEEEFIKYQKAFLRHWNKSHLRGPTVVDKLTKWLCRGRGY